MYDESFELTAAIRALVAAAQRMAAGGMEPRELPGALADSSVAAQVNVLAGRAAQANGYGIRGQGEHAAAGRQLSAVELRKIGLTDAISAGVKIEDQTVVEIGEFLAGPAVPMVQLIGIDADVHLSEPIAVGDWQLFAPSTASLEAMQPVPSLAAFQHHDGWRPELWAGAAFLRRELDKAPVTGLYFRVPPVHPEWPVWRPLTTLALAQPDLVTMWSEHQIEPGRRIDKLLDEIVYNEVYWDPAADEEPESIEEPSKNSIGVTPVNRDLFSARVARIAALLPDAPVPGASKKSTAPYLRIERAARRLLAAGRNTFGMTTPWQPVHATDSLLNYVIALEVLLGSDTKDGDITRKLSQRAAVLTGLTDVQRESTSDIVRGSYRLRSNVMHGSVDPAASDLTELRDVVRRVLIARLVHDRRGTTDLEATCDRALLSGLARAELVAPLEQYFDDMGPLPQ